MVTHVNTITFQGINVVEVDVQVHFASGLPSFTIVGLPDKIVGESKERVRAALSSLGLAAPLKKITVNLAPADLSKEGSHFDLPIALAILGEMGLINKEDLGNFVVLGELGLDSWILPVSGVLPAAMYAYDKNLGVICPEENGSEALWAGNLPVIAAKSLLEIVSHFKGDDAIPHPQKSSIVRQDAAYDLDEIKGQNFAKRALEIAASGGHNILFNGPPGAGKSMLASRLPSILPPMDSKEILECSMISSISGKLANGKLMANRPFRAPHHSCSMAAMVGGGMGKRTVPGEVSLAHNGVLFLDELPEFPRQVLDSLRQPLETGDVVISRVNNHVSYPAKFQLVAAMNPCRCGYLQDESRCCNKAPRCGIDYQGKLSGPLLDRIDLHIEVNALSTQEVISMPKGESSKDVAQRVLNAREKQKKRFEQYGYKTNATVPYKLLSELTEIDDKATEILNQAMDQFKLSMRSYNKILKVARTIADLMDDVKLHAVHVSEALTYRPIIIKK